MEPDRTTEQMHSLRAQSVCLFRGFAELLTLQVMSINYHVPFVKSIPQSCALLPISCFYQSMKKKKCFRATGIAFSTKEKETKLMVKIILNWSVCRVSS